MGQYHIVVNLDKKQWLEPHAFGEGTKLMEFGCSAQGTMLALAVLLADSNGRGGGDLRSENPIIGSWAGDRIVIAGDYGDEGKWLEVHQRVACELVQNGHTLYRHAKDLFENVSEKVALAIIDDTCVRADWAKDFKAKAADGIGESWFATSMKKNMPEVAKTLKATKLVAQKA